MHYSRGLLAAVTLLCLAVTSCKKNESPVAPGTQTEAQNLLMTATNDIVSLGNQESQEVGDVIGSSIMGSGDSSSCRTVTFDPSRRAYPHEKTIDFGSGCLCPDGLTRAGKKMITMYANPDSAAAGTLISETTFSNFWVDGVNITGDVKSYVETPANPGPRVMKVVADKGLTDSKGNSKTFTSTSYWTQTEGAGTLTHQDDVFSITSTASGNETLDGSTAIQWTSNSDPLHPIIKPGDCYYRTEGGLQINLHLVTGGGGDFTEYLDYGNGTCDRSATLTINGGTPQNITLPLAFWPLSL